VLDGKALRHLTKNRGRGATLVWGLCASLVLAGCGGSGDDYEFPEPPPGPPPPTTITISGTVQKGLFDDLDVSAFGFDDGTGDFSDPIEATVTDQDFSVEVESGQLTLLEATGSFTSEFTGETVVLDEPLLALVDAGTEDIDANINLATTLSAELALQDLTTTELSASDLIDQQDALVGDVLGFPEGTDPSQLDFNDITEDSDLTDPSLSLLIYSGGIVQQLESDQLFAGGFGDLLEDFLVAESLEEAQSALNLLSGLSATNIYDAAAQNSGYELPPNPFGGVDTPILTCIADGTCDWQSAPAQSISVGGNTVWEASGRAAFVIRLGEAAIEPVTIQVRTQSATATVDEDFLDGTSEITIPVGRSSFPVSTDLVIDALAEGTEDIAVTITSDSSTYSVYQGSSTLRIRDGAPSSLDNQDAADIQVLSFTLDQLCVPGANPVGDDCVDLTGQEAGLGLIDGEVTLGDTTLDLAADCSDPSNCPSQSSDWRVDFYLVARDSVGTRGEVPLGPYIYDRRSLQLIGTQPAPRGALVRLDDIAAVTLASDASANGWDLELEARIGSESANQVAEAIALPSLLRVPDTVLVGDTEVDILAVTEVVPGADAGCSQSQWAITGNYGSAAAPAGLGSGTLCVDFNPAAAATPAVMVEGELALFEGGPLDLVFYVLPEGLNQITTLADSLGRVAPTVTTSPFLALLPPAALSGQEATYELHAPGWPIAFRIARFALTPEGVSLDYDNIRYIHDVGYSDEDPRAQGGGLYSNDAFYRGVVDRSGQSPVSQGGRLILDAAGVDGGFSVFGGGAAASTTAFPRLRLQWQTFSQEIVDSELQPTTVTLDEATLRQRSSCAGPDCVGGEADVFTVSVGTLALDNDGFSIGDALNSGPHDVPRWGIRGDGTYAWTRPDDLTLQSELKLALPGYVIPDDGPVTGYLLAHLDEAGQPGDITRYPAGTDAFVDGNYHPTGLSIGPEIYRGPNGQPAEGDGQDLGRLGGQLLLDNGVDPVFALAPSPGVKYVIRNAGITGVFNVQSGSLGSNAPQFYGYQLDLERFAVRAVDNVLDTFNWIDGRLALNGDAGGPQGLDLFFTNLEIDCSARLGNVDLLYERCDGQDNNGNGTADENCGPELYSWKASMDIFSAGFDGGDAGQVCAAGAQDFALNHHLHFEALNDPVAFDTLWNPAGNLVGQAAGQLDTYRFDRSEEGKGFPVRTTDARLGVAEVDSDGYGWVAFGNTRVGVPFWNSLEADLRIANARRFGEITPEPTAVVAANTLKNRPNGEVRDFAQRNRSLIEQAIADGESLTARYEWGNTGFGFNLDVYYQPWQLDSGNSDPDARGRQSRFLGRDKEIDLFVLQARAGVNFIEPERTKLSFGASADFTRLEGLTFRVDITDPDSAAAVDRTLEDLGIINGPLFEPALTDFLDAVNVVNRYANRGMNELMQRGLELALEEIGEATAPLTPNGKDPFVTASELLAGVQGVPQQAIALVRQELRNPIERRLYSMEQDLRNELLALQRNIRNLPANAGVTELDDALGGALEFVERLEAEALAVDAAVNGVIVQARGLRDEARGRLQALREATIDIDLAVSQAVSFADSACSDGLVASAEGNGYLNDVAVRFTTIRQVTTLIRNSDQLFGAAEAVAKNQDVKRRLGNARQRIRNATDELVEFVAAADQAVRDVICETDQIGLVTARVFDITGDIRALSLQLEELVLRGTAPLQDLAELHTALRETVLDPVTDLSEALRQVRVQADELDGQQLVDLVGCILYDATHLDAACDINTPAPPASLPQGDLGVNALAAETSGQRDLADYVFDSLRQETDRIIGGAEEAFVDWTADQLPGAYMSPEELRRMVVSEIMGSEPIHELRLAMDEHFGAIGAAMNDIVLQYTDQLNEAIQAALAGVTGPINDALSEATSVVRAIPLQAAQMDGYATIAGNELERAHLSAGWTMRGSDDSDSTGFKAALDAESWSARNAELGTDETDTGCAVGESESLLDVKISAYGLPINVLAADIDIEKLYLGFTLQSGGNSGFALTPVGVFGGISTLGEIGFTDAIVFDPAFGAGLGTRQTYIGASAGAAFSGLEADVAFLIGKVCPGNTVLNDLDPQAANFLPNLDASGFAGAYLRGGATIPIIPGGCGLNVGVSADFGSWILANNPLQIGGLVGGGARGDVLCIASIKGKVRVGGTVSTAGDLKLRGEAWGVAGVGFDCDPGTWTSVPRSRGDSWCGTGDVQFNATFDNGNWQFTPPSPAAIF